MNTVEYSFSLRFRILRKSTVQLKYQKNYNTCLFIKSKIIEVRKTFTCLFITLYTKFVVFSFWGIGISMLSLFTLMFSSQATENWEQSEKSSDDNTDAMLFTFPFYFKEWRSRRWHFYTQNVWVFNFTGVVRKLYIIADCYFLWLYCIAIVKLCMSFLMIS